MCKRLIKFLIIMWMPLSTSSISAEEMALIANQDVPENTISLSTARSIFTANSTYWGNNASITVFVFPDTSKLHIDFTRKNLHLLPYRLRRIWDKKTFTGTGTIPITVNSIDEMIKKVSKTPGSIGYLSEEDIDDAVKIINIQ